MSHTTITLDAETAVDTLEDIRRRLEKRRLEGTEFTAVTFKGQNGEWLEVPPKIGDVLKLEVTVTCVERGKKLTDDGLQNTCKLEVTGIRVLDRPSFD